MTEVTVRTAVEQDAAVVRDVFEAVYGTDYPYRQFYDATWLKKSIFSDDILTLVAETSDGIVGTASVVFSAGARSDFVGEFGRLAVHPDARGLGIGTALMQRRIEFAEQRLHAGIIENRTAHPFSQRIALHQGFAPVGFLPLKHMFHEGDRESIAMFHRLFGPALELRRNHPRVVPEAHTLAHLALDYSGLRDDLIVDELAAPYPHSHGLVATSFDSDTMAPLLRIERGRVTRREIFGPIRLHYGFFKLSDRNASYIVAHDGEDGPLVGAIGYLHDEYEHAVRVFELIARSDEAPRFLLEQLIEQARIWGAQYLEIDVSAHAPRMQRTLVELGFVPSAYMPALVFDDVERVDVVKMVRLLTRPAIGDVELTKPVQALADVVMAAFQEQTVLPQVEDALDRVALFEGLGPRERRIVAALGQVHRLDAGETLFATNENADAMYVVLDGEIAVQAHGKHVGNVGTGESLGEVSMLVGGKHTASAMVERDALVASFDAREFDALVRRHPDVGLVLYRNLAQGLGSKLRRVDASLAELSAH